MAPVSSIVSESKKIFDWWCKKNFDAHPIGSQTIRTQTIKKIFTTTIWSHYKTLFWFFFQNFMDASHRKLFNKMNDETSLFKLGWFDNFRTKFSRRKSTKNTNTTQRNWVRSVWKLGGFTQQEYNFWKQSHSKNAASESIFLIKSSGLSYKKTRQNISANSQMLW